MGIRAIMRFVNGLARHRELARREGRGGHGGRDCFVTVETMLVEEGQCERSG